MVGMENFIPDGWDQLVANIYVVLRAASRPKRCLFHFPFQKTQFTSATLDLRILGKGKFLLDRTIKQKEI